MIVSAFPWQLAEQDVKGAPNIKINNFVVSRWSNQAQHEQTYS